LLSFSVTMRILLAISILVLAALLWATISIGRHIRKSRQRARFLREKQLRMELPVTLPIEEPAVPAVPVQHIAPTAADFSFAELAMKSLALTPLAAAPALPPPTPLRPTPEQAPISAAGRTVAPQTTSAGALGLIAAARKMSQDMPQPQMRPSGIRKAFVEAAATLPVLTSPPPPSALVEALPQQPSFEAPVTPRPEFFPPLQPAEVAPFLSIDSPEWPPRKLSQPIEPIAAKTPTNQPDPLLPRPVRSVPSSHPSTPFVLPLRRPDWAYFNKDMGDLSDPLPSRMRDRVRSR